MSYTIVSTREDAEHTTHTVGFYDPAGAWHPHSDHGTIVAATIECHHLNGGNQPYLPKLVDALENAWHFMDALNKYQVVTLETAAREALARQLASMATVLAAAGRKVPR